MQNKKGFKNFFTANWEKSFEPIKILFCFSTAQTEKNWWKKLVKLSDEFVTSLHWASWKMAKFARTQSFAKNVPRSKTMVFWTSILHSADNGPRTYETLWCSSQNDGKIFAKVCIFISKLGLIFNRRKFRNSDSTEKFLRNMVL